MKTEAKVIADSISPEGARLTTLQVCFPRFILAEVNTHRVLSRNYRSSRAVPVAKLIDEIRSVPFMPSQFTRNKPGMQGGELLTGLDLFKAESAWRRAADDAASHAEALAAAGVHKQYANRGLEPYLYVHGVISATEWDNFFALRCHPDAQPEFQELAHLIRAAIVTSTPVLTEPGDWHLPYVQPHEQGSLDHLRRLSAARCAWVSYKPFDEGEGHDYAKANRTFDKLMSTPMHASPMEHVATPMLPGSYWPSNFCGWTQWRHMLEADRHG
jgi:thymidylate synthase ThyX